MSIRFPRPSSTCARLLICLILVLAAASPAAGSAGALATPPNESVHSAGCAWTVVPSPNVGNDDNSLASVIALPSGEAWAVGYYRNDANTAQTLAERWDRTAWSVVSTPNVGTGDNILYGVAAQSRRDLWAVGSSALTDWGNQPLILRGDGSTWQVVPSPTAGISAVLYAVAASGGKAWAVGQYVDADYYWHLLVEQWDGTAWAIVPAPDTYEHSSLFAVTAVSESDVWTVGSQGFYYSTYELYYDYPLVEHWDGVSWQEVSSASLYSNISYLTAVSAVSATDIWAVGWGYSIDFATVLPFIEHWNGTRWIRVPAPVVGTPRLLGVAAVSSGVAWAVGAAMWDGQTLTERYNGRKWQVISSPNPGSQANTLNGAALIPFTQGVWAVGYFQHTDGPRQTLTMRNC